MRSNKPKALCGVPRPTPLCLSKKKDRYSAAEVARVQALGAEAQAAYAAAEDALRQVQRRAPFAGIVYALPVEQGADAETGDLLLQEGDLYMLVRAFVDEPDIGRLATGENIEVTWDALPDRIGKGVVNTVPSTVKLRGAATLAKSPAHWTTMILRLLPNVNVGVTVITAEHSGVLTYCVRPYAWTTPSPTFIWWSMVN